MRYVVLSVFFVLPAIGQLLPGPIRTPPFPAALQRYLELSTDQVNAIVRLNAALQQFQSEKFRRAAQVQFELAQETAKTTLDPMALGVRHLELEAIQRELRAEQEKTYTEIQKVLTAAQQTKVQALIEAMRLQNVICEAQAQSIIPGPTLPGIILLPGRFLLGDSGQYGLGCTSGIRTGDFTFVPPQ